MTNNHILRRLRYTFDFDDSRMIEIFALGGIETNRTEVSNWLKKDIDPEFVEMTDRQLNAFLDGLIVLYRGKKEGQKPKPFDYLNNNLILRKLKIALNLKDFDMLNILKLAGKDLSKHELSAFFRKPGQKQYRECQNQVLRNFLQGLQKKYRDS
ncbi:MAG TPA: DUF1456 family protein [Bacteroidetes bacterium]|nr:DUF1456 family protein [Bacteroidota bacterium]